jgi:hypothetical protein
LDGDLRLLHAITISFSGTARSRSLSDVESDRIYIVAHGSIASTAVRMDRRDVEHARKWSDSPAETSLSALLGAIILAYYIANRSMGAAFLQLLRIQI